MNTKTLVLLLCSTLLSTIVLAQKNPVRFGLRAGLHFSRFQFDALPSNFNEPSGDDAFYVGIQFDVPLAKRLSLVAEGNYAMSSVQAYENGQLGGLHHEYIYQLLFPLLLKYKFGKLGLYAGPQAEMLQRAEVQYQNASSMLARRDVTNSSYKKLSYSGVVGAELTFKYRFGIDVRYQFGLTDFRASNGTTGLTEHGSIQMNAFQTGFFFRFGKKPGKKR